MNMKPIQTACFALIGSAFVLGALLLVNIQDRFTPQAEAGLVIARDRFTLLTARTKNGEENLFVIENSSQKLLVYKVEVQRNNMFLAGVFPIGQFFAQRANAAGGARPNNTGSKAPR
jgi:hypothetical protein